MSEGPACTECGSVVEGDEAVCAACIAKIGSGPPVEGAAASLGIRVAGALVYTAVGAAAAYLSIPFFQVGDWWFGMMGAGLVIIAVLGVKQSLFPKEWKPE